MTKVTASILEEGIVLNYLNQHSVLEVEDLYELKNINREMSGGGHYCVVVEAHETAVITDAARKLSASKEFLGMTIAKALIIKSLAQRISVNFYMKINKPVIRTKGFENRDEAIQWLRREREQSLNRKRISKTL